MSEFDRKEELLNRIKAAKEKSSKISEEISEKDEIKELEKKAIFEENKARDLPHIQAAEEEYGEIRYVNTPLGAIVVKSPHHLHFQRFSRKVSSSKGWNETDLWNLVRPCIVYPDMAKVDEIIEAYPGVAAKLGSEVIDLGNGDVERFEGK